MNPILEKLARLPLLSADEEKVLARRRDAGDRSAVDELVYRNQRLVMKLARRHIGSEIDVADLVGAGQFGLLKAAERFDPGRGTRFSTFATYWVRQAIQRHIQDTRFAVRVPIYLQGKKRKPGVRDCCFESGRVAMGAATVPLDGHEPAFLDADADAWEMEDEIAALRSAIGLMNPRNAEILKRLYGLGGSKPEGTTKIAKDFGLTKQRIHQIKDEAIRLLRETIGRQQVA